MASAYIKKQAHTRTNTSMSRVRHMVSNHRQLDCFIFVCLFFNSPCRLKSKKISEFFVRRIPRLPVDSFPEPKLPHHQRCSVTFIREQFHKNCSRTSVTCIRRLQFKIATIYPMGQCVSQGFNLTPLCTIY